MDNFSKTIFSKASVERQLENCSYCPKMCRHSCPVSNTDSIETHTPQSKMDILNQLRKGTLPWTQENSEPLWACTGCRQCTTYCEHSNEPGLVLLAGRAESNTRGAAPESLKNYPERFQKREQRLAAKFREAFPQSQRSQHGDIGFWPGCDSFDKQLEDVHATMELFERISGKNIKLIDSDKICGGYPLLAAGYPDTFRLHAEQVAQSLSSFKTIITNCSACIFTMQKQYAAEGVELLPKVIAVSQYLVEHLSSLPHKIEKKRIYYHDPCHLARSSSIIDEPRRVLSRVAEIRDFDWSHTDTECCGGAGLLPKTAPDTADSMARKRLREISNRGGGVVVTSCATCTYMLKSNAPSQVQVMDLSNYLRVILDT